MQQDLASVLIDRDAIARRITEVARQIGQDLGPPHPTATADADATQAAHAARHDGELTLVPILTGSIIFVADLIRQLPQRMQIHLMSVSSYPGTATTSQGAKIDQTLTNVPADLSGRHVLLVDDILDSGNTLRAVTAELRRRGPASLRTCVLLRKRRPEALDFPADYVGFDIPDEFVVGYGLDYDDYYRNLPDIGVLRPEVIGQAP